MGGKNGKTVNSNKDFSVWFFTNLSVKTWNIFNFKRNLMKQIKWKCLFNHCVLVKQMNF